MEMQSHTKPKTPARLPGHVRDLFFAAERVALPLPHYTPEVLACHLSELHATVVAFMAHEPGLSAAAASMAGVAHV